MQVIIPGDKLTEVCAAAHSLGVIGLTEFLPVPAETQRPALISKEPLQIAEESELRRDINNIYNSFSSPVSTTPTSMGKFSMDINNINPFFMNNNAIQNDDIILLQTADEDSRNINTDPDIIPISFSDSVVAGPGDMAAVRQTQQLYPSATDSGEQYRIIPEILSDGTFHEETIDSCFSLFPGPGPAPGDTQELRPAKPQSQDHQHHLAGVKTPVHNNPGHLHLGHGKTMSKLQQSPAAADVSLPMSGGHQTSFQALFEAASTEHSAVVENSAAELPESAVSCPSLVFSSSGSSPNPAGEPLDSTVISSQNGPFIKLVRGKMDWDFGSLESFQKKDEHLQGISETVVYGGHGPENHEDPAEEPLDSNANPSQNRPFVKFVRGKMGWDFSCLESLQKKDGHSESSRSAGIQTEETGIQRRKRSPYTPEEIEEGLQLLLSSTRTYRLLLKKQKETGSITLRLPSVQTCRLKIQGFKCPPGLNPEMLFLMEKKFDSLPCPEDKNCVLSCDEMDLNKKWSYDQRLKRLFPPHKVTMMYE